jgi:putative membrane protein
VGARTLLAGVIPDWLALLAGSVLIFFAAFCLWAGVWRELHPGAAPPRPDVRRLPTMILIVVNVVLIIVALAALVGIWLYTPRSGGAGQRLVF